MTTSFIYLSLTILWAFTMSYIGMATVITLYPNYETSRELFYETHAKLGLADNPKMYAFLNDAQKKKLRDATVQYYTFGKVKEASSSPEKYMEQTESESMMGLMIIGVSCSFLGLAIAAFIAGGFKRLGFPVFLTILWGIVLFYMQFGGRSYTYSLPVSFYITESLRLLIYLICFFAVGYFSSSLGRKSVASFKSKKVQGV